MILRIFIFQIMFIVVPKFYENNKSSSYKFLQLNLNFLIIFLSKIIDDIQNRLKIIKNYHYFNQIIMKLFILKIYL